MEKPTKSELLAKYALREPREFEQWDAFDLSGGGADDVMRPDEDGFCIMGGGDGGKTYELMSGCCEVRVLIRPDASSERAMLALRKVAGYIEEQIKRRAAAMNGTAKPKQQQPDISPDLSNVAAWLEGSKDPVLKAAGGMIWLTLNREGVAELKARADRKWPQPPPDDEIPF